jgi:hypothetical protein
MSDDSQRSGTDIEREKIELERYKARLDYRKFVLGSVFVALAIAAIPPLFQLATAVLEFVRTNADRQTQQQAFHDEYVKDFINNAINQDIELRIRFAQYFARVSTEPSRDDWLAYLKDLRETRDAIRTQIDKMEAQWSSLAGKPQRDETEIARLERNLAWAYKEVGYVEKNRSAAANPRASPESTSSQLSPVPAPPWLATMREITGTQWSPGDGPSPIIVDWARFIATKYPETADYLGTLSRLDYFEWAGLAVTYCMAKAGIKPPFGSTDTTKFLWSPAWLAFGTPVDTPQLGDVLIFDFGGGAQHVAPFEGLTEDGNYVSRGGNQSHEVRVSIFPKRFLVGIRRPVT